MDDLIYQRTDFTNLENKMPVLFVGHGSPMNAIEDNEFSRAWIEVGQLFPGPGPSFASPLTGRLWAHR